MKSSTAASPANTRSTVESALRIQPFAATASAISANTAETVDHTTLTGVECRSRPRPRGSMVNANGTTNAGAVYFHDNIVVRNGLPPVIAAAANGDSAVGGLTSDSTA